MIHFNYTNLHQDQRDAVDEAYDAVAQVFKEHGLPANGADPAERLVEAIATFLVESRKA